MILERRLDLCQQIVVIFKSKEKDLATSIPLGKKFPQTNDIRSAPEFRVLASKVTAAIAELISAGSSGDLRDAKEIEKFERELNSRINRREENTSSTTLEREQNERDDFTQMDILPGGQDDKNTETYKRSVYDKETSSSLARAHFDSFAQHHAAAIVHPETNDTPKPPDVSYVEVIAGHSDQRISAPIHEQTGNHAYPAPGPEATKSNTEQYERFPHEGPVGQESKFKTTQHVPETLSAVRSELGASEAAKATSSSELLGPTKTPSEAISTESAIIRKATLIVDDLMESVDDENVPDGSPSDTPRVNLDALMRTYTAKTANEGEASTTQSVEDLGHFTPSEVVSCTVGNLQSKENIQEEPLQGYRERDDIVAVDSKLQEARDTIIELLEAVDNDQKLGSELSLTTVKGTASRENQHPEHLKSSVASLRQVISTASSPDENVQDQLSNLSYASPSTEEIKEPPTENSSLVKPQESQLEPAQVVSNVPLENTTDLHTDVVQKEQVHREREDSKKEETRDTIVEVLEAVDNNPQFDSQLNVATPLAAPEPSTEIPPDTPLNTEEKQPDYLTPSDARLPEPVYSTTSTQDAEEIVEDFLDISPSKLPVDSSSNVAIGPLTQAD
ncbi:hypothetical protein RvY_00515 [Ramazzottius varieornatus]|uniref:Uncharacterized protein n=1 Tax=Ramazzottius varieornatus TaxID=947166 RepID=A0A1D1UD16_RAMVA|nr:hypothetical protein RvY_00515 [Ramazzottius varieornatus]